MDSSAYLGVFWRAANFLVASCNSTHSADPLLFPGLGQGDVSTITPHMLFICFGQGDVSTSAVRTHPLLDVDPNMQNLTQGMQRGFFAVSRSWPMSVTKKLLLLLT